MNKNLKEPWFVKVITKISQILLLTTGMGVLFFIVISMQGLSENNAYIVLNILSLLSFVNIIFLIITLVFSIVNNKKATTKIASLLYNLLSLVLTVIMFVFVNSIFVLSKGSVG